MKRDGPNRYIENSLFFFFMFILPSLSGSLSLCRMLSAYSKQEQVGPASNQNVRVDKRWPAPTSPLFALQDALGYTARRIQLRAARGRWALGDCGFGCFASGWRNEPSWLYSFAHWMGTSAVKRRAANVRIRYRKTDFGSRFPLCLTKKKKLLNIVGESKEMINKSKNTEAIQSAVNKRRKCRSFPTKKKRSFFPIWNEKIKMLNRFCPLVYPNTWSDRTY